MRKITTDCIEWIKRYFDSTQNCNAVIGISGGKDSTIAAALCKKAIGADRVIGVLMPNGEQSDIKDSKDVCSFLRIHKLTVDISTAYNDISRSVFNSGDLVKELSEQTRINLAPRIRMTTLYAIAQSTNGRVVNTSNFDESLVGYCTLWGDNVGDFAPLKNLHVSEILEIGEDLEIPYYYIHKAPSDGLTGMTDEEKMGFSYLEVEDVNEKIDHSDFSDKEKRIFEKINSSSWKREMVKIPSFEKNTIIEKENNTMEKDFAKERAKERVDNLKNKISDFLCKIQGDIDLFKFECEENKWNDDLIYDINEACLKLGFSLANLQNWFEDEN